jgi:cytochrome oxidase Cu insertion factor (SCO1/SenC/PrrC family)
MRSYRRAGKKRKRGSGRTIGIAVLVVIAAVLVYLALQPPPPQPQPPPSTSETNTIGRTAAPDFSLQDVQGNEFKLSDFRGKVVVLEFMGTTCPHCANEMPQLVAVWKRFGSSIVMISINVNQGDTDEMLSAYASEHDAPWVWARDTANVASAYKATGVPTVVIIDPGGGIAYVNVGETPEAKLTQQIQTAQQ